MSFIETSFEYNVFARINRGDNLILIGEVEAQNDELAKVYATFIYDEEDWAEMCVVRKDQICWVRQLEGLFEKEGVGSRE